MFSSSNFKISKWVIKNSGNNNLRSSDSFGIPQNYQFYFFSPSFDTDPYYRRKATYLDEKYFVRNQFDFKMNIDANLYNYDERFTTSHDHLLSKIIANDRLESYLLSSIYKIEGYFFEKFSEKSPLTWTFSKSGLVELLYALHTMHCFNGGNVELSEITRFIEKSFNVELGNVYKTLHEIKNRKTGRTKFLQALEEGLEKRFEEGEE